MNLNWVSQKSAGLLAILVGLGFLAVAYLDGRYRYFHLAVAAVALYIGYRRVSREETPFEKRERELRRHFR